MHCGLIASFIYVLCPRMPFGKKKQLPIHTHSHTHVGSTVSYWKKDGKAASRRSALPLKCVKSLITPTPVQGREERKKEGKSGREWEQRIELQEKHELDRRALISNHNYSQDTHCIQLTGPTPVSELSRRF